jgi:hypothetical protein
LNLFLKKNNNNLLFNVGIETKIDR